MGNRGRTLTRLLDGKRGPVHCSQALQQGVLCVSVQVPTLSLKNTANTAYYHTKEFRFKPCPLPGSKIGQK